MKLLCVCAGGRVRSQALALAARFAGHEALAVAATEVPHSDDTFAMLSDWADVIVFAEDGTKSPFSARIPLDYRYKIWNAEVGPDKWGNPQDEDLRKVATKAIKRMNEIVKVKSPSEGHLENKGISVGPVEIDIPAGPGAGESPCEDMNRGIPSA